MSDHSLQPQPVIEWGFATRAAPGQSVSGDVHFVHFGARSAFAAVVDGLGHGTEAEKAARMAVAVLEREPGSSLEGLMNRCHAALIPTRGAVMTLAWFNQADSTVSCLGVGNVEGALLHTEAGRVASVQSVLLHPGVVGLQLPPLRTTVFRLSPGDLLILASDGIAGGFAESVIISESAQLMADHVLRDHFKGADDALVLVIRYLGAEA